MLAHFLEWLSRPQQRDWDVVHHEILPRKPAQLKKIPKALHPGVAELIRSSGINSLYSHQAEAIRSALAGNNVVLSTSTASGKTLCYQAPVLDTLVRNPEARALLLFPLKALERDQRDAFLALAGDSGISAEVYDGDTPEPQRRKIKSNPPRVIITNPDMLHLGMLAYHDGWKNFFGHLAYVVLDEVHTYKGIFGTHISQVILRLRRVCAHHGSQPKFIACSATVANPGTFVSSLISDKVDVVNRSGAAASERHFIFIDPVLSPYTVTTRLFVTALKAGLKTIVFTRARKMTELITTWVMNDAPELRHRISSYRAGFLPEERREIERKLFSGKMDGVISTSALEMGIDVGGLDLCLLVGYPGTIVNTWQRGGRVGRADRPSAIVMLAGNDALDQYFLRNPDDFFRRDCEEAVLDPFNPEVLKRHLPCAAAEVPIRPTEEWKDSAEVHTVIEDLIESGSLYEGRDGSLHSRFRNVHRQVDLRGIGESYPIFLEDGKSLVGVSSGPRAFKECHEGAVYLHRARQYVVTKLDLERRNVLVKPARLEYYTRALAEKDTEILGAPLRSRDFPGFGIREARLKVTERIISYEKRRNSGQDLIGCVDLELPPLHFETVGIWIEIPEAIEGKMKDAGLHFMGGIHALEHAAISMFPLFALCDRDDIGGISTPRHEQVCRPAVFIYDGHPGGVGLAHRAFEVIEELLEKTRLLVEKCPCDDGCPSCIHSPKCGSGNKPLDKEACLRILRLLLDPNAKDEPVQKSKGALRRRTASSVGETRGAPPEANDANTPGPAPKVIRRPGRKTGAKMAQNPSNSTKNAEPRIFPDLAASREESPAPTKKKSAAATQGSVSSEPSPRSSVPARVVVFDLETQKLAQEVGGWKNISKMLLSLGVAYTEDEGFVTFTERNVERLVDLLKSADLVVGFNQMRFDYEVLKAYTNENLRSLPNLDILVDVQAALGHRLNLDHLAEFTLGERKSGSGLEAAQWFREGKLDLLEKYCRDDVRITRDLYRFGLERGFLIYQRKDGVKAPIAVDWRNRPRTF